MQYHKSDHAERLRAAAIGTLTGFSAALALSRVYSALLYGVNGADPLSFLLVLLMIGLVNVAGCYIPARSASRIDPVQALKAD